MTIGQARRRRLQEPTGRPGRVTPGRAPPTSGAILEAADLLARAETLLVLTGSGMSAESGIPTFRGTDGLWEGVRPEAVATPEAFARDSTFVWRWYKERLVRHGSARPHAGHKALTKIQALYGRQTLATQNVDDLHERAGSSPVLHLHGSLARVRCDATGRTFLLKPKMLRSLPPPCPDGDAILRPDVVWFGETLPEGPWREASAAAASCEGCLVVGTSNLVYPAAALPQIAKANGATVVEVNPERTPLTTDADVHVAAPAAQALPAILAVLRRKRA